MKYCLYFLFAFTLFGGFFVGNTLAAEGGASILSIGSIDLYPRGQFTGKDWIEVTYSMNNVSIKVLKTGDKDQDQVIYDSLEQVTQINSDRTNLSTGFKFNLGFLAGAALGPVGGIIGGAIAAGSDSDPWAKWFTTLFYNSKWNTINFTVDSPNDTSFKDENIYKFNESTFKLMRVDYKGTITDNGTSYTVNYPQLVFALDLGAPHDSTWYLSWVDYFISATMTFKPGKQYCINTYMLIPLVSDVKYCPYTKNENGTDPTPTKTTQQGGDNNVYTLLEPLPIGPNGALQKTVDVSDLSTYINILIKLLFALAGAAAVVMIIKNGFIIMTSNSPFSLKTAKDAFLDVFVGLLLMLSAYGILNTINPNLVNLHVGLPQVSLTIGQPGNDSAISSSQSNGTGYSQAVNASGTVINPEDSSVMETVTLKDFGSAATIFGPAVPWPQKVNKDVKASFIRVIKNYASQVNLNSPKPNEKITSMWSYASKKDSNIKGTPSAHNFGLAIDINAATNPFVQKNTFSSDIPQTLISAFKSEGWGWGGDWSQCGCKDPMHFSKLTSEGGSGEGSYSYK